MKVYYTSVWSTQKDFGGYLNDFIALLPEDAWVCVTDADSMFLTDYYGKQIEDIIEANPSYSLIGCKTNRLRSPHQLYKGEFSEDTDIMNHIKIAEELYSSDYSKVSNTDKIAGICMIFPKRLWTEVKFEVNTPLFDTLFCYSVRVRKHKIGIAEGLYLFHKYRLGKTNPIENNLHLFNTK